MMTLISAFEPRRWIAAIPAVVCCAMVGACSASSDGGAGGTGGSAGASGTGGVGAGGASGASGSAGTGGGQSSGGAPTATGGAPTATGGAPTATGGAPTATGGSTARDAATGACTNAADEALINGASFDKTSTDCGTSCFVNLDPTGCAATCMAKAGLSQACAACYGADIECGIAQCAGPCAADSASAACRDCVTQHCDPAFIACAGSP